MGDADYKRLSIRSVQNQDFPSVFNMFQNKKLLQLWSPDTVLEEYDSFKEKIKRRIRYRWQHSRVFVSTSGEVFGFSYCYNASESSQNAYVSIVVDEPYIGTAYALQASYLYFKQLFDEKQYRQLYAEVFEYNYRCIKLLQHLEFQLQGQLTQHQKWQGRFWNQNIYRLTRQQFDQLCDTYKPLLSRER